MKKKVLIMTSILLCLVLGLSYASFVVTSENYKATEMMISKLVYGIEDSNINNRNKRGFNSRKKCKWKVHT